MTIYNTTGRIVPVHMMKNTRLHDDCQDDVKSFYNRRQVTLRFDKIDEKETMMKCHWQRVQWMQNFANT